MSDLDPAIMDQFYMKDGVSASDVTRVSSSNCRHLCLLSAKCVVEEQVEPVRDSGLAGTWTGTHSEVSIDVDRVISCLVDEWNSWPDTRFCDRRHNVQPLWILNEWNEDWR